MTAASQSPTMNEGEHSLPGPGGLLRAARESAGVSLRDISAQLHLDERTIDALESDDFRNLPAPTFVRGYLRGYARLLSVPVGPVMEAYDREGFRPPDLVADISEEPEASATDFPVSLITWVVVLILGAMVVVWWNNNNQEFGDLLEPMPLEETASGESTRTSDIGAEATDTASAPSSEQEPAAADSSVLPTDAPASATAPLQDAAPISQASTSEQAPASAISATGSVESTTSDAASRTDEVLAQAREALEQSRQAVPPASASAEDQPQSSADTASQEQAMAPAAPATEQAAAPNDSETQDASAAGETGATDASPQVATTDMAHLELKFAEEAWVEIYDRDNNKLFYDLAKAGETADLRGPTPLRVLLGRTRGVEVRFNEQPFDVKPFEVKGVARFTLP